MNELEQKKRRSRRKPCDDELGWILITIYCSGYVMSNWYKTFSWAERKMAEFKAEYKDNPESRAFIVQVSEVQRWHQSTGIDELERMMRA